MSLSFISKSIQTVKDDGEFEEKEVENPIETTGSASLRASSGLFDQLRKNKDQEDAEREELQRSMTRGTLALDEDDAAHLNYLESIERKRRFEMQTETRLALEDFRVAQAERPRPSKTTTLLVDHSSVSVQKNNDKTMSLESSLDNKKRTLPTLIVKKKKRRNDDDKNTAESNGNKWTDATKNGLEAPKDSTATTEQEQPVVDLSLPPLVSTPGESISSLLGGYYSSSSEDDA